MYPTAPDHENEKYSRPGVIPNPSVAQPANYHVPPYITRVHVPAAGGPGNKWSSGLCHCCDDPANCKYPRF